MIARATSSRLWSGHAARNIVLTDHTSELYGDREPILCGFDMIEENSGPITQLREQKA